MAGANVGTVTEDEVVITRIIDAPREKVFAAWTDPAQLARWWGPKPFTSPRCEFDPRPGGRLLLGMRSPDGRDSWTAGTVREIQPPSRLVFATYFADERGERVSPAAYGLPADWSGDQVVTVTFDDERGRTRMTMRQTEVPMAVKPLATLGWATSLEKLDELVAAR